MADTDPHRVVVIGGGYAGLTTAARIGEAVPNVSLTLIDAKPEFVERIRLHEIAGGSSPRHLPYKDFMTARHGRFVQAKVAGIDPNRRQVKIDRGNAGRAEIAYDTLVYAPGSYTDRHAVPGADTNATCLDTTEGSAALGDRLTKLADSGGSVLIAGGGLTAIEAACEFGERLPGLRIILAPGRNFAPGPDPGDLSRAGFDHVIATLQRLGVEISAGARIAHVHPDHAEMEDGGTIPFDVCLWAAGFLVPPLAADAGIEVTESGQVVTDSTLTSVSHPDILAVGDAAHVMTEFAGKCRMSCAAGRPMGELAAHTFTARLSGTPPGAFDFSYSFRCVSLGREDGLIQFVDATDRPVEQVWTGERGAIWKEYICRRTLAGVGFDDDLGPPPDTPPQIS
ncbi:MAG: NADH dehydrogenase [Paracoccaceae bacterium]|jgi:NADH dehydrogenase